MLFGYGEQQSYLERIVKDLNLTNKVEFRGERKEISEVFDEIDIFCLFSLWEGFPNVLAEALAFGVPSAGFESCDGVNDLIQDGINGWKIPFDDGNLSAKALLSRAYIGFKSGQVSATACQNSVSKYAGSEIYTDWEKVLRDCLN